MPVSSFPPAFYSKLGREGKEKAIRRQRQSIHLDGALSLTAPTHLLSGRTSSLRGLFLQFKLVAPIPSCVPKSFEIILFELVAVWVGFIVLIDAPVCCLSSLLSQSNAVQQRECRRPQQQLASLLLNDGKQMRNFFFFLFRLYVQFRPVETSSSCWRDQIVCWSPYIIT